MMHVLRPGLTNPQSRLGPPSKRDVKKTGFVATQNRMVGFARMRQVRVRNDSCAVHRAFSRFRISCYGPYTADNEDTEPYGAGAIK